MYWAGAEAFIVPLLVECCSISVGNQVILQPHVGLSLSPVPEDVGLYSCEGLLSLSHVKRF